MKLLEELKRWGSNTSPSTATVFSVQELNEFLIPKKTKKKRKEICPSDGDDAPCGWACDGGSRWTWHELHRETTRHFHGGGRSCVRWWGPPAGTLPMHCTCLLSSRLGRLADCGGVPPSQLAAATSPCFFFLGRYPRPEFNGSSIVTQT